MARNRRRIIDFLIRLLVVALAIVVAWALAASTNDLIQIWIHRLPEITAPWSVSDWITNIELVLLWLAVATFAVTYLLVFRFWDRPEGLALAAEHVAFALVLTLNVLGVWTDRDFPGRETVRPLFYNLAILAVGFMCLRLAVNWLRPGTSRKIEVDPRTDFDRKKTR